MKIKSLLSAALAVGLFTGCACEECEKHGHSEAKESELMDQAKVSKETAQASAIARVPGGIVKEGELEKEKGKLIWSFDIALPDSKDIKEVAVDAITGDVIAVDTESPDDQAKEAAEDAKKKKEKDDKD